MTKTWFYTDQQLQVITEIVTHLSMVKRDLANNGIAVGIAGNNPYKNEINAAAEGIDKARNAVLKMYSAEMDARALAAEHESDTEREEVEI